MKNKNKKYFSKFNDSIHKERILAKLMKYNYKILIAKICHDNAAIEKLEVKRDIIYIDAVSKSVEYLDYCKMMFKKISTENAELKENLTEENRKKIKENQVAKKFLKEQYKYYKKDFRQLLKASVSCVQNGEVVPFEKFDDEIKQNITYENAFDVIDNLASFSILGFNLADINYRCKVIRHNMPIFMTKSEYEEFEKKVVDTYGEISRCPEFTDMAIISNVYDRKLQIEKELYESVFPEFGFKYEDREKDTTDVYTMEFTKFRE